MNKITTIIVLVVSFFALFSKSSQAITLFYDNFEDSSLSKWDKGVGDTSWSVKDKRLYGENYTHLESKIYAKGTQNLSDFTFKADVENRSGMDQHYLFRVNEAKDTYYQLELRYGEQNWNQIDVNSIRLWKFVGGNYSFIKDIPFVIAQNQIHSIKVVLQGPRIQVYLDSNGLLLDWVDPLPILSGAFGLHNYSGDFGPRPTINFFDNIKIFDGEEESEETKRNKIVIIPGMGASWSEEGVVLGLPANNWRMTPFVGNYNGLINSFKGVGLTENADFYVWNYDWRKPVESIKNDFNLFVNNNIGTSGKIDVVGHSLGGVVARVWAKENSDKAGKIISLGSPQQGALSAYDAWNGGKVSDKFDVAGVAFNILLQLHKNSKLTIAETVHEYSPVIKDLLPTFEYLYKNNNLTTPKVINNYLITQNQSVGSSVNFVTGKGVQTKFKINVGQQNLIQKVLNIWPDGEPVKYENGDGDGTVIVKSSRLGENSLEINSNHGDVVDKSINNVLTVLGLNTVPEISSENNLENKMVFYIGSPAKLNLICGDKTYESHDFIVASETNCTLKVIGESNGVYHLVYGYTNSEDSWGYIEGKTTSGLVSSWEVDIKNNKLILETDKNNTKDLLKYELNKAKIRYHENWLKLLLEVKGNAVVVGYIKEILMDTKGIDSKLMARLTYEKVSFGKKMVEMSLKDKKFEKLVTPTKALNVIEYQKTVKENEEAWNNKDYRKVWVTGMIADKYFIDIYQR